MKKKVLLFSVIAIIFIALCIIIIKHTKNKVDESNVVITGVIEIINPEDYLVLNSDNGLIKVYYNDCNKFNIGQKIKVIYDGSILESLPPKISAISIELIK